MLPVITLGMILQLRQPVDLVREKKQFQVLRPQTELVSREEHTHGSGINYGLYAESGSYSFDEQTASLTLGLSSLIS